jgi:micrococcal nuclease
MEKDLTQSDKDVYGRLLRYVWLENGTFFNQEMLEGGFAKEYTYSGLVYQRQNEFLRLQERAKQMGRGLWGVCDK